MSKYLPEIFGWLITVGSGLGLIWVGLLLPYDIDLVVRVAAGRDTFCEKAAEWVEFSMQLFAFACIIGAGLMAFRWVPVFVRAFT